MSLQKYKIDEGLLIGNIDLDATNTRIAATTINASDINSNTFTNQVSIESNDVLKVNNDVIIDESGDGGILYLGEDAYDLVNNTSGTFATLTNATGVFVGNVDDFVQLSVKNKAVGSSASTDIIAYCSGGDNDSGWIDMGITSDAFDITSGYGITDKNDGYIFMSAPVGTTGPGNLVIATSAEGQENDIVFVTGGFDPTINTDAEKLRIIGQGRTGKPAGVEIYINTESTSPTTGALRIEGGVGIRGSLNLEGEVQAYGGAFYQGQRADGLSAKALLNDDAVFTGYIGLTNASGIFTGDADDFVQFALKNHNNGESASTDIIAYASDGDNDSGWIDMGCTSETFADPDFTVTGPGTGYLFYSAPVGTTGTGDLLIGTDETGSHGDIVFFTNGFDTGNERVRIIGESRPAKSAGVEIYAPTESTTTTTGALRVQGGIGLQGNMNIGGNITIQGTITIGGEGSAVNTTSLQVEDSLITVGKGNATDNLDLGIISEYGSTNTTALTSENIDASVTTIPVDNTTGFPTSGTITIDNEDINYTGITATEFTGCTRGSGYSSAITHESGSTVRVVHYSGLVRDASDGTWKLFKELTGPKPVYQVNFSEPGLEYAALQVDSLINETLITTESLVVNTDTLVVDAVNSRVGINTDSPTYDLQVVGSFAATTKSFVIDHPTKIGMKLRYGSLEGPENGVYVRGKLSNAENVIQLPDHWTGLVDEDSITVNLTAIGEPQNLYVEKIEQNKVYVANNVNCFYTVYAERKDVDKLEVEF